MAHKWAGWLHNHCRLGVPRCFRTGEKITSGPKVGRVDTYPLPRGGPQRFTLGEKIKSGPQGPRGYITTATSGFPNALELGRKSEMAHNWAQCLHNPHHLRGARRFIAGDRIRNGQQLGRGLHDPCRVGVPKTSRGAQK